MCRNVGEWDKVLLNGANSLHPVYCVWTKFQQTPIKVNVWKMSHEFTVIFVSRYFREYFSVLLYYTRYLFCYREENCNVSLQAENAYMLFEGNFLYLRFCRSDWLYVSRYMYVLLNAVWMKRKVCLLTLTNFLYLTNLKLRYTRAYSSWMSWKTTVEWRRESMYVVSTQNGVEFIRFSILNFSRLSYSFSSLICFPRWLEQGDLSVRPFQFSEA